MIIMSIYNYDQLIACNDYSSLNAGDGCLMAIVTYSINSGLSGCFDQIAVKPIKTD
jgi:hypothetical protein